MAHGTAMRNACIAVFPYTNIAKFTYKFQFMKLIQIKFKQFTRSRLIKFELTIENSMDGYLNINID